ncbi:MAG: ABC transporter substrate-binding protein [Actinomycetota bacterium]|nr:ABC transporter substrate-binding protein [Actinomycetota bacterium]
MAARAGLAVMVAVAAALAVRPAQGQAPAERPLVRIPFPEDARRLTPYTFELGYPLVTLVYDTLMWRDAAGTPRPWLAESVTRRAGGRRVTIRLRRGVRWHDGAPLTAADVTFTFGYVARRYHPRFTPQLEDVERVQAEGRDTVVITLRRPSLGFADQPLADLPILPRHLWSRLPPGRSAPAGPPVGSGPYRVAGGRREGGYRLRANRGYFRGAPLVRTIAVSLERDADRAVRALARGRVDMVPAGLPEEEARRLEDPSVRIARGPSFVGTVLMFNLRRPPFDRPAARRAVAVALNLRRIAAVVGRAVPAERGYLHPASRWSSRAVLHRFEEGTARAALRRLDLPVVHVLANGRDPVRLQGGREAVSLLRRAGARARLERVSAGALARAVGQDGAAPTFQAAIWSAPPLASHDPGFLPRVFGPPGREAPLNYSGYRSAAFDRLAARVAAAPTAGGRRAAVGQELRLLARDVPVVPLLFAEGAFAYRPSAYDRWVFVRGSGILDKRSFLPGEAAAARRAAGDGDDAGGFPIGALGVLALALLAAALGLATAALLRRRR